MTRPRDHRSSTPRLLSMGVELAAALVGFCLLGYWIDTKYDTTPWGLLICACLGLVGGMYNLIRTALAVTGGEHQTPSKPGSKNRDVERTDDGSRRPPSS